MSIIEATTDMAGFVFGYHIWINVPQCARKCEGAIGGFVLNPGGTHCRGNVSNMGCNNIKARTKENINVAFVAGGLTVFFEDISPQAQFKGGCSELLCFIYAFL